MVTKEQRAVKCPGGEILGRSRCDREQRIIARRQRSCESGGSLPAIRKKKDHWPAEIVP